MKDYDSYKKGSSTKEEKPSGDMADAENAVKSYLSRFNGLGEDVVLEEVFRQARSAKQSGSLSNDQIDGFVNNICPSLTPSQQKKMRALAEKLKAL